MEASGAEERVGGGIAGGKELARNALGLPQILFCIVTGSAPITAMAFNDPVAIRGVGIGAPAAFWVATVVLTIFSIGYVAMARRVTTAGGFYSFTSHGFGRVMGLGAAVLIAACYMLFAVGVNGVTAYFANTTFSTLSDTDGDGVGFNMDWRIYAFCFIALMFAISYFHVESIAKILGITLICELAILLIFSFGVLVQGGKDFSFAPLNPAEIFGGSADSAFLALGGAAVGIGLFAAFWSWVGFEMAPNYAEEARNPKKMMAYAIYISCIGLGILYTFVTWMLIIGYGGDKATFGVALSYYGIADTNGTPNDVLAGFPGSTDFQNVFYPVTREFLGIGILNVFKVLVVTGSFACSLAFWNTASRYLFAMGREGILPRWVGRTHATHRSPFVAALILVLFCTMVTALFAVGAVGGSIPAGDPLKAIFQLGTWIPFMGVLGILSLQAIVSLAIMWYFLKPENRDGFHPIKTFAAPIIAFATQGAVVYAMVDNRVQLAGDVEFVRSIPYYVLGIFTAGCALALFYRSRKKDRYDAVGRFVHEEA